MPESGPWEEGGQGRVQKVHLPGMGANWPWRVREKEGGAWDSLLLGGPGQGDLELSGVGHQDGAT